MCNRACAEEFYGAFMAVAGTASRSAASIEDVAPDVVSRGREQAGLRMLLVVSLFSVRWRRSLKVNSIQSIRRISTAFKISLRLPFLSGTGPAYSSSPHTFLPLRSTALETSA